MKILIATTHRGVIGGTESYLSDLLPALEKAGNDIGLIYDFEAQDYRVDAECKIIRTWTTSRGGFASAVAWRPDLCYSHGLMNPANEILLSHTFPTVVFVHNHLGNCASGMKCNGWGTIRPCTRRFGPSCLGLNYIRNCRIRDPFVLLAQYRNQRTRRSMLKGVKSILVASRYMADELERHGGKGKTTVCPLFIASEHFNSPFPNPKPFTNRILFSGRLTELKGCDLLIHALPIAERSLGRSLHLHIAGTGPREADLRSLANQVKTSVEFHGWCDRNRLNQLRSEVDLLIVPSVWPEPFGLVGIEAGSQGIPAVGFRVGGIPEWLIEGRSGELAPSPPTPEGLAEAITRALHSPEHHQRLREGAWTMARRFSREAHLQRLLPIFSSVCGASNFGC